MQACLEPVVHVIDYCGLEEREADAVDRSRAHAVFKTCKEAKAAGLSLQQSYFVSDFLDVEEIHPKTKNYFSSSMDTFWLCGNGDDYIYHDSALALYTEWTCGKCKTTYEPLFSESTCGEGRLGKKTDLGGQVQLNRLAINAKKWVLPELGYANASIRSTLGSLSTVLLQGIQEVLIVVEEHGDLSRQKEIVFVAPSCEKR